MMKRKSFDFFERVRFKFFKKMNIYLMSEKIKYSNKELSPSELRGINPAKNKVDEFLDRVDFETRAEVVKEFHADLIRLLRILNRDYASYLEHNKGDKFPTKWMANDRRVMASLGRYKPLLKVINSIHNTNKYISESEHQKIRTITDKTHNGYTYCLKFIDDDFYEKLASDGGCSISYVKRIWKWMRDEGIIKEIERRGRQHLYALGYYLPIPMDRYRKISFITREHHLNSFRNVNLSGIK